MVDKEGWVYVLTNEAMPGIVKVGHTMNDPAIRAEELSSDTGVPLPFVVAYKALVVNPKQIELKVHGKLHSKRLNNRREFFKCEPFEAIRYIRETTTIKYEESKEDIDRRIQHQKELEEQDRIRRKQELDSRRSLEEQNRLEEIKEKEKERKEKWKNHLGYDLYGSKTNHENTLEKTHRHTTGIFNLVMIIFGYFIVFGVGGFIVFSLLMYLFFG